MSRIHIQDLPEPELTADEMESTYGSALVDYFSKIEIDIDSSYTVSSYNVSSYNLFHK